MLARLWFLTLLLLTGCGSGAVVFAPTPAPPDLSPLRYDHPSGAFTALVPRHWPAFTQNATTLAAASFSPPGAGDAALTVAVIRLGEALDSATFGSLIDQYQTALRPDVTRYKEESREAMGDGSWRMSGLRRLAGGETRQLNTFFERSGDLLAVIDVVVPDDVQRQAELQSIVNSVQLLPDSALDPTDASALVSLASANLEILNLGTWATDDGVFYVTGEVANYGLMPLVNLPVRVSLRNDSGQSLAEAEDTPMSLALLPGGFAPFSLRFGQGQPAQATHFELLLGGLEWQPESGEGIYGPGNLDWIDESSFNDDGALLINGTVTNIGQQQLSDLRAAATVFDGAGIVIGAGYIDLATATLGPNESTDFQIILPELGGNPAQYIVNIQGKGSA